MVKGAKSRRLAAPGCCLKARKLMSAPHGFRATSPPEAALDSVLGCKAETDVRFFRK